MPITRDEIARIVSAEGFDVTSRTVRYWEQEGLLPRARPSGNGCVVHSDQVVDQVRYLALSRSRNMREPLSRGHVVSVERLSQTELRITFSFEEESDE
jgi:hypothetical protein